MKITNHIELLVTDYIMEHGVWPDQLAMGYETYLLFKEELLAIGNIDRIPHPSITYYAGMELHITLNRCGCKVYNKSIDKMVDSKNKA